MVAHFTKPSVGLDLPSCGFWLTMLALAGPTPALAKDLDRLANSLSPAFLAQNLAVVCAARDPSFLPRTRGSGGTIHAYAQHIKDDVTASLPLPEAATVLKAADAARSAALQQVLAIASDSPEVEAMSVSGWREATAPSFVRTVTREHEINREAFEQGIAQAKAP